MKIQDFADMEKFESIMSDWAVATGLATVAVGADGKYISECYNFTDFCIKLTSLFSFTNHTFKFSNALDHFLNEIIM